MANNLLVICGPTATGKTALGIALAKKFNGEVISADSRQVYKGMDIGTGKDIPVNSKFQSANSKLGYYKIDGIKIYGYDLVSPKEEFSVSDYLKFAKDAIAYILNRNKLPILVGGTGFYIKAVTDGVPTASVPKNNDLREKLSSKSAYELFESLSLIDSFKAGSLNTSDKKNPRRLIRAIEVAQYLLDHKLPIPKIINNDLVDALFIGLSSSKLALEERINKRVDQRVTDGFQDEISDLLKAGVSWSDQSMLSLGYRQWRDFLEGGVEKDVVIAEWKKEERKYSKRQMVWWKNDPRVCWFNIDEPDYQENVENMVKKWYISNNTNEH
jgi:tRNA dimethylallyltransferase